MKNTEMAALFLLHRWVALVLPCLADIMFAISPSGGVKLLAHEMLSL